MKYDKPVRCSGCGSVVPLDALVGYTGAGVPHCINCEVKEQAESVFLNDSPLVRFPDLNMVKLNRIERALRWCFG